MDGNAEELVAIVQGLDAAGVTLTVSNRPRHIVERRRPVRPRIHINSVNRPEMNPAAAARLNIMPAVAGMHSVSTLPAAAGLHTMAGLPVVTGLHTVSGLPVVAGMHTVSGMPVTQRTSVETTTGTDFNQISKGSQICDDRYTSSYKMAHCQITPSSPPEAVSEFPPQRREPCRNQGNFEIGGNGSARWSFHSEQGSGHGFRQAKRSAQVRASTSRIRQNGSQIWRDRGSSHRYCNSNRDTDAFEHSLRKYPNVAPFRTASTDLIEKLIRYTQAKNFQETSHSSKSVRSLRHPKTIDTYDLASKHQQTYTRRQDLKQPSSSGVQVGTKGKTKNFKLYSPVSDSRNLRNRGTAFSTSYDYLKAGSPPDGRSNRSDGSPIPSRSRSPEETRSPAVSPVRFGSPTGSKKLGSPDKSKRAIRPLRFERSVRDLSLSEMSKYIRTTVRQICNERAVVFQVCPKLKNRYNQHKRVCPSKSEKSSELVIEDEPELPEEPQASGSVLSRIIQSFSRWPLPFTEQAGCQCSKVDCNCSRATQCTYYPEVYTNNVGCSCKARTIEAKTSCSRGLSCVCTIKSQEQAYYKKKIDEAVSEWLQDVPVHITESQTTKRKRETAVKELREALKQLPNDEDFDENVRNEIGSFISDLPLWNPGEDEEDEMAFKNQLADKLIQKILAIARKPDRFREVVTKWVGTLDFEGDNEEIDVEDVIEKFDSKLKPLAAERPTCDLKYLHILKIEIIKLLDELPLNYDRVMIKRKAHQLATEILKLPRNVRLSDDTDAVNELEENISEWICEHGLCRELKKDPKLIESLANKLKSQGVSDAELIEAMKELVFEFVDDLETAVGILDEFVDELMKPIPGTDESMKPISSTDELMKPISGTDSTEKAETYDKDGATETGHVDMFDQDELTVVVIDWLRKLPGASNLPPSKFDEITAGLIKMIQDCGDHENEDLEDDIFEYIIDTKLRIDPIYLHIHVDELIDSVNVLTPSKDLVEQTKRNMVKELFKVIDVTALTGEQQGELRKSTIQMVKKSITMASLHSLHDQDDVKDALLEHMNEIIDRMLLPSEVQEDLKRNFGKSMTTFFDKSSTKLDKHESDLIQTIEEDVRRSIDELPIDADRKEDLMSRVSKTLCRHMHKPLPPNVKQVIKSDISNIFDSCKISEDRSLCGKLKNRLFDIVGQILDMFLPKPVCDFQCKIEKDMDIVVDRCPMDSGNKKQLKKCVQDTLTKNSDRPLSEEVISTIEEDINSGCSILPIPKDKKDFVKNTVGASVSKNLNDALMSISHDLNKLRNELYDNMTNAIEKSPIARDVKTNLKSRLQSVLKKNLDSSVSDDKKHIILDEVSDILKFDVPEQKRKNLTDKLSRKIDVFQKKEESQDLADMITEDVSKLINRLSIDSDAKENMTKEIKDILLDTLYNALTTEKQQKILEDIMDEIDDMNISKEDKNNLKSNIADAVTNELNKLITKGKEVPEIKTALEKTITNEIKDSSISEDKKKLLDQKLHDILADNLVRDVTNEEKEEVKKKLGTLVDDLKIDRGKGEALKAQLLNTADKYLGKSTQDKTQTKELTGAVDESTSDYPIDYSAQKILKGLEKSIDQTSVPNQKKSELKKILKSVSSKNLKPQSDDTTPKLEVKALENKTKKNILQGLETAVNEAPIPKDKKTELKKKLEDATTKQFKSELSDDVAVVLKDDMDEIIDEMNLPKDKKNRLKNDLNASLDENMNNMHKQIKDVNSKYPQSKLKELENDINGNIQQKLVKVINEAPIPKEKKQELQKQVKDLATKHFKKPLSDDAVEAFETDANEVIGKLNMPKDVKDKLKGQLTATLDENMGDLKDTKYAQVKSEDKRANLENEIKGNIVKELDAVIDNAPLPQEKKLDLKKKLQNIFPKHFKKPLTNDVGDELKDDINEIIDRLNLPKDQKDDLKSELTATVDENMRKLQSKIRDDSSKYSQTKPKSKVSGNDPKVNIQERFENFIDNASIPNKEKLEFKKKIKEMSNKYLGKPLTAEVADLFIDVINDVIDELNLSQDMKDIFKMEMTAMIDDNMRKSQTEPESIETHDDGLNKIENDTKVNIQQGLKNIVDDAPIPREKKTELNKILKDSSNKHYKIPLSDDAGDKLKDDINTAMMELNAPKATKDKLENELTATVDDNMRNLQRQTRDDDSKYSQTKPKSKVSENETKANIQQGLENVIDNAPLPRGEKQEFKKTVKDLSSKHFKKPLTDDVAEELKDDLNEVTDEVNLPKAKRNDLKSEFTATVDKNMNKFQTYPRPHEKGVEDRNQLENTTKANIQQGLKNIVDDAPIPREKKTELNKILKDSSNKHYKIPLSDDAGDKLKDDINTAMMELNAPKATKDKLENELTATVDDNMRNLQRQTRDDDSKYSQTKPKSKVSENETKANIQQGLENVIENAPLPRGEKQEFKKTVKDLSSKHFKKPLTDDVAEELKDDLNEVTDEVNLPKAKRNDLKSEFTATVDKNMNKFQTYPRPHEKGVEDRNQLENTTKANIQQELKNIVDDAPIPREKKTELNKILKDSSNKHYKIPLSDDAGDKLKDDINTAMMELNAPKATKDKLENELTATVDDNMRNLQRQTRDDDSKYSQTKPKSKVSENETKANIQQGLENVIENAPLPRGEKQEFKKTVKDLSSKHFKKPLTDDVAEELKNDLNEVTDEVNLPKAKRNDLKSEFTATVDKNMNKFQTYPRPHEKGVEDRNQLENTTKANIQQGLKNIVDDAPIPREKKTELNKILKDSSNKHYKIPLSDDAEDKLKDDINTAMMELNVPKATKDKLENELTATVDKNMRNLQKRDSTIDDRKILEKKTQTNILQGHEKCIDEAKIPTAIKVELKKKLKDIIIKHFMNPVCEDVVQAIKDDITEVIDDLDLQKEKKNELKTELIDAVDEHIIDMLNQLKAARESQTKRKTGDQQLPVEETKVKDRIMQGLGKVIEKSAIPENKKRRLSGVLQKMADDNFKKRFSSDDQAESSTKADILKKRFPYDEQAESPTKADNIKKRFPYDEQEESSTKAANIKKRVPIDEQAKSATKSDNIKKRFPIDEQAESVTKADNIKKRFPIDEQAASATKADNIKKRFPYNEQEESSIKADNIKKRFSIDEQAKSATKADNIKKRFPIDEQAESATKTDTLKKRFPIDEQAKSATKADNIKKRFSIDEQAERSTTPDNLKKRFSFDLQAERSTKADDLKTRLSNDLRAESSTQFDDFHKLKKTTESNIILSHGRAVDANIPKELRQELKKKLKELTMEHFMKPITNNTGQAIKDDIFKVIDDLDVPEDMKDQLKIELAEAVDENMKNLLKELEDLKKPAKLGKKKKETEPDKRLKDIFDKYGIDPSYQKELSKELDNLLDIMLQGGDVEDARRKLIEKLMRDLNLSEAEATALADEIIGRAQDIAFPGRPKLSKTELMLKEQMGDLFDKYGIDPNYQDQLAKEFKKLLDIARKGGDFEDARRKLIKKLMQDLKLPEKEATALTDDLIDKARKMALQEKMRDLLEKYGIDPSYEDQLAEEFQKLLEIARKGGDFEDARKKLINKLMQDLKLPKKKATALTDDLIDKARKMALIEKIRDILDKYEIDPNYEDNVAEKFNTLLDTALKGGDFEEARDNLIKELMRDLSYSEAEASALADDLIARARELAIKAKEKEAEEYKEAFSQAISDAVDQSTVDEEDKPILKNKLLGKLKQILDQKPFIQKEDIGPLKKEVLKECYQIVDESSIPADKKNELKSLLKDKLDKAFEDDDDGETENLSDYKDKITRSVKKWMDSLPIRLDPEVAATVADNIASDILDRHKYLQVHPEARSSDKDEIENLKYQVFRRMNRHVDPKVMPKIMAKTPDLYKMITRIQPPPPEPKKPPKPKDATAEGDSEKKDKMKELKKVFAKSVDEALVESSLSLPDKNILKKKLLEDLGISSAGDKKPLEYKNKIRECVKTWLETLPVSLDPKTVAAKADDLTDDILERQEYLRTHPEVVTTDEEEIKILMNQVTERLKDVLDLETIPDINKRAENLYYMIMNIKKQLETKQERATPSKRKREPSPQDKKGTSAALSSGNINYSLKELIATKKDVRNDWTRNLDDAMTKIPSLNKENLKNTLALYDENGQVNMLSTASRYIAATDGNQGTKSKKQFLPKNKVKSGILRMKETFAFINTTKQNSPFNSKQNQFNEKDYAKMLNETLINWLDKLKFNLSPKDKNKFVDELAADIVEKQKYASETGIQTARSENAEYFKFQIHRRLHALIPEDKLKSIGKDIEELIKLIENISTNQTTAPPKSPPKSSTKSSKSTVTKKKNSKQKKNGQAPSTETDTSTEDLPQTVADDTPQQQTTSTEFSPGQASTPTKGAGEDDTEKVKEIIKTWMESVPINLETDVQTEVINDLVNDIIDRRKYLQVHPEKMSSKREEIENLRFQVFKRLNKVTDDETLTPDTDKIEELYRMVNGDGRRKTLNARQAQEFLTSLPDEIANVLNSYNICCERRELLSTLTNELGKLRRSDADQDEIIDNLIESLKRITYLSECGMCDEEAEDLAYKLLSRTKKLIARIQQQSTPVKKKDFREAIMEDIGDVFHGCPMTADKRRMMECQLAEDYARDLGIPLDESEVAVNDTEGHYGMSFNGLTNFIDTWLSSIHIDDDDTNDDSETSDKKKEMAYSLIHKIGEMNIDPEIFNDDALYEAVLRDELQNMLGDITTDDADIDALKEDLISKVLEAKQRAHDEFAGQDYKRNLRDTMSKVLPEQRNLSKEEEATMKTLKDQLADAYIDLHFAGNNVSQIEKLKKKISNELSRFCKDYMNRVPCSPLSSQKLNQDLYDALNNVPLPAKDSIRYEVEQARIREEINDWLKELPIQPQTPTELFARNKQVYVLAKKLFDIEKEGNDKDNDSKKEEIVKFLIRLPLETEEDIETLPDMLIEKLVATEESRKYNPSANVTIDSYGNVSMSPPICSGHKLPYDMRKPSPGPSDPQLVCGRRTCLKPKSMSPSTLTPEDKEYLQRIRRRTRLSPNCVRNIMKGDKPKPCPGPRPVDAGSQTVLRPAGYQRPRSPMCRTADERTPPSFPMRSAMPYSQGRTPPYGKDKPRPPGAASQQKMPAICPGPSRGSSQCATRLRRHMISSSNVSDSNEETPQQPQIIIKQYYWTPNDKNGEGPEIPQNARSNRGDPLLTHQTSQTQCDKLRKCSYAQCTPPPCYRPNSSKTQQQDLGPQRVPYDFSSRPPSCSDQKSQRQPTSGSYDPQRSCQRPLNRDLPSPRTTCAPTPCLSPFNPKQPSPPRSPFSQRDNECRVPKRDGLDHHSPISCNSRSSRNERVIELGSLDDLRNPRPMKRHNDANDWQSQEEEQANCWYVPIRRVVLDEGIDDSAVTEKKDDRVRCKCKEREAPKPHSCRSHLETSPSQQFMQGNQDEQNLKKCAKCCGRHCPYPSYLYFRQ